MSRKTEPSIASDLVAHFIIRGWPVMSAHKGRVGVNPATGKAQYFPSDAWGVWFESAISQVERTLKKGGYFVNRELVLVKHGDRRGMLGKTAHGQPTYVTNPLFKGAKLRVIVWYYYPTHVYQRDDLGQVKMTIEREGKPARPKLRAYNPDTYNVAKGAVDALVEGGAIKDDDNNLIETQVERAILPADAEPYIGIEVKYFTDDDDDWVIPREFPGVLVDPRVYMPRVFDSGHEWHVVKRQEQAYQQYLRDTGANVPDIQVTKCRCKRCKIFIGEGCLESEIWWDHDETRWGKEVHLICRTCGEKTFAQRPDIVAQINDRTLKVCADNAHLRHITAVPEAIDPVYGTFDQVRRRVHEKLLEQYARKYCLVAASDIATVDWLTIEQRRSERQVQTFGESKRDNGNSPQRQPLRPAPVVTLDLEGGEACRPDLADLEDEPGGGDWRTAQIRDIIARRHRHAGGDARLRAPDRVAG